ncbi:predicted protein [Chaetomium globosum CBS 148.51]|uniref:Uncharacterized protein n=1 Tax=Chaetomium globosum (strain ATCC 6205 / CBS 148.51 / DSM 1962 / NBRC 6347 / NRRL 1970) TaxID=306901 RepID=Q2HE37_CHAGB|nr:uncharacterized protein CHGG_01517 [Chaetomium globosum CBS 148.51]EAQ93282.1 predicted protein [Chaetomium globosum CBS 148.51]
MAPITDPKPQEGQNPSNNGNPEPQEPPALSPSSSSVGDNLAQALKDLARYAASLSTHVLPRSPRFGFSSSRTAPAATTGAHLAILPRNNTLSTLPSPHHWVTLTASQEARDTTRTRPDHLQRAPLLVASWTRVGGYPYSTASQLTTTPPITKQNRGEQAASTLEANLTNLEGKLDEILASFGVSAADLDALDEQEAAQKKKSEGQECGKKGKGEKGGSS